MVLGRHDLRHFRGPWHHDQLLGVSLEMGLQAVVSLVAAVTLGTLVRQLARRGVDKGVVLEVRLRCECFAAVGFQTDEGPGSAVGPQVGFGVRGFGEMPVAVDVRALHR